MLHWKRAYKYSGNYYTYPNEWCGLICRVNTTTKKKKKRTAYFSWCDIIYGLQSEELCFLFDSIVYVYNSYMENWAACTLYTVQSSILRVFCSFLCSSHLGVRFLYSRSIISDISWYAWCDVSTQTREWNYWKKKHAELLWEYENTNREKWTNNSARSPLVRELCMTMRN